MSSDSGEPRLVLAPPDQRLEDSCWYARGAERQKLIDEVEAKMTFEKKGGFFVGIDYGLSSDDSYAVHWIKGRGLVDHLPPLRPKLQGSAADAFALGGALHVKMKALLEKMPPIKLAAAPPSYFGPPLMEQEVRVLCDQGLRPGELYFVTTPQSYGKVLPRPLDSIKVLAEVDDRKEKEIVEKLLGYDVHESHPVFKSFHELEREHIDETERKMLGENVVGFSAYEALAFVPPESLYTRELFAMEYMGDFSSPEKEDDESA